MNKDNLSKLANIGIITAISALVLAAGVKYILPATLPLLTAFIISCITRPIASFTAKRTGMPYRICGIVITSLIIFFTAYITVLFAEKLLGEMSSAISSFIESLDREDNVLRYVTEFLGNLREKIPFLSKNGGPYSSEIYEMLIDSAKNAAAAFSEGAARRAAAFIASLPDLVFASIVCVIAVYYFTCDFSGIKKSVAHFFPFSAVSKLKRISEKLTTAFSAYVKAYFILMALTFGELFFGFVILRIRYAFFLALIVAVVDILPVLGVGTVLLPWSAFSFMIGNNSRAVGILILFAVMYAVRQFTEPRLVGRFMGLHPLLTLGGAFAGYSLFGLWGILFSPVILYGAKLAAEAARKKEPVT